MTIPDYQQTTGHPIHKDLYYQAIGIFRVWYHVNSYPHWSVAQPGDIMVVVLES